MDYRAAIDAHKKSCADVTAIYARKTIDPTERENTIAFDIDDSGRVRDIVRTPNSTEMLNVSLGAYIMQKRFFIQLTAGEKNCGMLRFSGLLLADALERLNIMTHEFRGYTAHICSIETFFHYNMEMLDIEKRNALFDFEGRRIFTYRRDSLPTKYGKNAEIKNSIVADGCQIEGTVINSVVCRNVKIGAGAIVKNCILQDDTSIGNDATLDCVIADRAVVISDTRNMVGYRTYPVYIERSRVI
jgi:glucose-1-phosphate adenylyltransferase